MSGMILVDTNILIDVLDQDENWAAWSIDALFRATGKGAFINAVVVAELGSRFDTAAALEATITKLGLPVAALDIAASFHAASAFRKWIASGGRRGAMLPDFLIGGHAVAAGAQILTRDPTRFRRYFPELDLITPSPKEDND
jgi:predicted nucleic acid-binding protein